MSVNDGKYLEKIVEEWLDANTNSRIVGTRLPDSHSARNFIKAQNADFLISSADNGAFHLECKSVGGTKEILRKFRQYPLMQRWAMAGVPGLVLIHYYDLRLICLFPVTEESKGVGIKHWNVRESPRKIILPDTKENIFIALHHACNLKWR